MIATGTVMLPIAAAVLPDGSANNAAPAIRRTKTSAGPPAVYFLQLDFDPSTKEQVTWSFRMPADYTSGPVLKVQFKMTSATSGNVIIEGRVAATSDGDAVDLDAKGFGAANTSAATAVPGTAGHMKEISLSLINNDSLAAGDNTDIYLARDAANASDTATGDMEVVAVSLEYTA